MLKHFCDHTKCLEFCFCFWKKGGRGGEVDEARPCHGNNRSPIKLMNERAAGKNWLAA